MKKYKSLTRPCSALVAGLMMLATLESRANERIALSHLGSYQSGILNQGGAEIVAYDPATQQLFVVNAQAATVDVLDISNPLAPVKAGEIDVKPYGAVANSVAARGGIIAVAVENREKTEPGKVVFFNNKLQFLSQVTVGALPDMLTFTPNGRYVLVANEGEPSDAYTVDPEGSVSVIDLSGGAAKLTQSRVRTADFLKFNNAVLDPSVRIFGPDRSKPPGAIASVAQDLEPEYITVSQDSKTAWVTCQENNAIAEIDIESAAITRLNGLGFKDHLAYEAKAHLFAFSPEALPPIGTTLAGQEIKMGGFSGLHFEGIDKKTGRLRFVTHTDRGPNGEPTGILRPFLLPKFTPEIVRFELDRNTGSMTLTERIPLKDSYGTPLTGLPNTAISNDPNQAYNDEVPVDLDGQVLAIDPLGADLEGIVIDDRDDSFWMVDEYRPSIYHFDRHGVLIERYVPKGTAAAVGEPAGTYGKEVLPGVLAQRRQNRGFEAVAFDSGKLYAFVQSPIRNPVSLSNGALGGMTNIRVVEFDPASETTRQFIYQMDNPNLGAGLNTRADKIGDAVALGNGEFLVLERDDDSVTSDRATSDPVGSIEKKVYRFTLAGATDVSAFDGATVGVTGKTVDQLNLTEMLANEIVPLGKALRVDLAKTAYNNVQKVEGLALIDPWTIAVINDNDFQVAGASEPVQLGIIDIRSQGLDTSDRDNKINIQPWLVKGMYLPDGIDSYRFKGETFLVLANEGDERDYPGFSERTTVGAVKLDPTVFPNATFLQNNLNLGRLRITNTRGIVDGRYTELFAFGARSFSIRKTSGELVWDSGDDFEWITAMANPRWFNVSHDNNTFDDRSRSKGPEPEGVVMGKAYGRDYAFIGLERVGGVIVYDVSDPFAPVFVDYFNRRNFTAAANSPAAGDLGPEGLVFIKAEDSPTGKPLLVLGNEISGTTTILEVSKLSAE